jgi:predicted enzyme related to lactoylglutathione lyase
MSEQDRYIGGVPCWVDTTQPNPKAAVAFYSELFGWEFEDLMPAHPVRYYSGRAGRARSGPAESAPDRAMAISCVRRLLLVQSGSRKRAGADACAARMVARSGRCGGGRLPGGRVLAYWTIISNLARAPLAQSSCASPVPALRPGSSP